MEREDREFRYGLVSAFPANRHPPEKEDSLRIGKDVDRYMVEVGALIEKFR